MLPKVQEVHSLHVGHPTKPPDIRAFPLNPKQETRAGSLCRGLTWASRSTVALKLSLPSCRAQGPGPGTATQASAGRGACPLAVVPSVNTSRPFREKSKLAGMAEGLWLSCGASRE